MHTAFLEIETEKHWAVCALGPAFLAAATRAEGHSASMVRVKPEDPLGTVISRLRAAAPDLIGLSITTRQWLRGRDLANAVRPALGVPVIAGGLHPTFAPEAVLAEPGFDAVCLGEGERPFSALVAHLEGSGDIADARIPNIWVKGGAHPGLGPPIEEIDSIAPMARDMLGELHGVVHMTTQRGCPFPCTYCAAPMYGELYKGIGTYGRRRSLGSVFAELDAIRAAGVLNYVIFLDDTFTINHPWVFEFCRQYPRRCGAPFSINARVETMNPKLIEALAGAGCYHVIYGVESGSERLRREVMKRPVKNDRLVEIFRRSRDAGMLVTANYMMGLPGETRDDLQATIDLHHRLDPVDFGYFVFYPYPGTPLFQVCRERGYLPENWQELPARHDASILDLPDLSRDDIAGAYAQWTRIREAATG